MKTVEQVGPEETGTPSSRWTTFQQESIQRAPSGPSRHSERKDVPVVEWKPEELTILLAEDNPELKMLLRMFLRKDGFTVLDALNGREALCIHEEHKGPIHLLLTDVMMPEMGGIELAERIQPLRPEMSVLFISGYPGEMSRYLGLSSPRRAFLKKPFRLQEMNREIRHLLGGGGQAPAVGVPGTIYGW
jgi:CheY-like chemotaxis protein